MPVKAAGPNEGRVQRLREVGSAVKGMIQGKVRHGGPQMFYDEQLTR